MRGAPTIAIGFVLQLVLWARLASAADEKPELPRYQFQVGQQLNYEGGSKFQYEGGSLDDTARWQITPVARNDDGSWRVIFRLATANSQTFNGTQHDRDEEVFVGWGDVDPSGNVEEASESFGTRMTPSAVLPKLPASAADLAGGWQAAANFDGIERFTAKPSADPGRFIFDLTDEGTLKDIYGIEKNATVTFDIQRGLVEKIESTTRQTYGFNGQGAGDMKLLGVDTKDAAWCNDMAQDAERFFAARKAYQKAGSARDATADSLDAAVAALKQVRSELRTPEFQQQIDRMVESDEKYRKYTLEEAEDRKSLVGQPAFEFDTSDLDEKPVKLTDYRGKVLLLDFWYRGCGWCIRAMPQLKEVAAHYEGKPVALVGMNTDQKVDDAKFVVEKLGLNYGNLKAEGLPEKFKVRGFPTLIVIDSEGKIRDVHVGWSANLKDDLIAVIDGLLAENPTATQ